MKKYFINESVVVQEFLGESFLLNTDSGDAFNINSEAVNIIKILDENPKDPIEIIKLLGGNETYKKDLEVLQNFLDQVTEMNLINAQ